MKSRTIIFAGALAAAVIPVVAGGLTCAWLSLGLDLGSTVQTPDNA